LIWRPEKEALERDFDGDFGIFAFKGMLNIEGAIMKHKEASRSSFVGRLRGPVTVGLTAAIILFECTFAAWGQAGQCPAPWACSPDNTILFNLGSNVGIGTTTPQRLLHLTGSDGPVPSFPTLGVKDLLVLENNHNANLSFIVGGDGYSSAINFRKSGDPTYAGRIIYFSGPSDDYMNFWTAGQERIHIDRNGNVGINTRTPASKLAVNGKITAKSR